MDEPVVFQDLLHGILDAASTAQAAVERQQAAQLSHFFHEDGRARTVPIKLPAMQLDAKKGEMTEYQVPLLSITPYSTISIHRLEVEFDVNIESLTGFFEHHDEDHDTSGDPRFNIVGNVPKAWKESEGLVTKVRSITRKFLRVGLGRKKDADESSRAEVRVTFRSNKPPEGFIKLNDELLKRF